MVNLELIHAQNPDCFRVGGMYLLDSKANAIFGVEIFYMVNHDNFTNRMVLYRR